MVSLMRPTVYLETTILSYLTARPSRDLVTAARQEVTRTWWETRRARFDCHISRVVLDECGQGDPDAAGRRLDALRGLPSLAMNPETARFATALIQRGLIPAKAADDALHIAVSALNGMRYLVTWNFTHIANAEKAEDIRAFCLTMGYACPVICSPDELMENP
jgi:hypothetical protein